MGDTRIELVHRFFSGTGPTYDFMVRLATLGFDIWWKQKILEKIPEKSNRIMDQGCGTGILTFQIARKFPKSRIVGVELRDEYLNIARKKAKALKLGNVEWVLGRAEDVLRDEKFDCITSSYMAQYVEVEALIRNIKKMLRDGGVLIMHDFTYPRNRTFARTWELYFRLLQRLGDWRYPQWREIYYGLPKFLRGSNWVTELTKTLKENAFPDIRVQYLTGSTSAIVWARKA